MRLVEQILTCFPEFDAMQQNRKRLTIVKRPFTDRPRPLQGSIIAFSVDTAVEEHGPHLPLGTDRFQSYHVLQQVADANPHVELFHAVDYGQLTWGLPFGFSIDLTAPLLTEYVAAFANAIADLLQPRAIYAVDVHGSIIHREAIIAGLKQIEQLPWAFRWLHEPLVEFASGRGDQHAGGVETALIELISTDLLDAAWWPSRRDDLARHQMSFEQAVELTPNLIQFQKEARSRQLNGIVGDINNHRRLDAIDMNQRMVTIAKRDVSALEAGEGRTLQLPGQQYW